MMRLRNVDTDVQVVVPDIKAARLIAAGSYTVDPDDKQPPKDPAPQKQAKAKNKPGPTSIAKALQSAAGPMWNTTTG